MSMFDTEQSSYMNSELDVSSKLQTKQDLENQQILVLCEKISQMERNYIQMEKYYAAKLKSLHLQLVEKDHQFKKLQSEIMQMKHLGSSHKKKVDELTESQNKKETGKSRSPFFRKSNEKSATNQPKTSTNSSGTLPNRRQADKKSQSPKMETKKYSPPSTHRYPYQKPMFQKPKLLKEHSALLNNNSSSQRFSKKSISPKNSYQHKKTGSIRSFEDESIKMIKKSSTGIGSLKEKPPSFK